MANKKFLEKYPLYKKFKTEWSFNPEYEHTHLKCGEVPRPAIHMYCGSCDSEQTFNMENQFFSGRFNEDQSIVGMVKEVRYICSACNKGLYVFLIHFGEEKINKDESNLYLEKVGQIPPWSIDMNKDLESILKENAQYYKKGLISESQGYGIGAHAYYRRIVEDTIDELLESIVDFISSKEELAKYTDALKEVKKTRIAQEKIEFVKDLLPPVLCPGGINPLQILHTELSEGVHSHTDEECLESADAIRRSLVYLSKQVTSRKIEHKDFTSGMMEILDKKSKKTVKTHGKQ